MSVLTEPRKPDCDICDWATAYHHEYGMNLCAADLDIANKIAKVTEQRIIKLLEELSKSTFPGDVWHVNPFEYAIDLFKNSGVNKNDS